MTEAQLRKALTLKDHRLSVDFAELILRRADLVATVTQSVTLLAKGDVRLSY